MTLRTFLARGRKALRMPPRQLIARLKEEVRQQTRRPWAHVYPRTLSDATIIGNNAAGTIDELWTQLAGAPFFINASLRDDYTAAFIERYPSGRQQVIQAADQVLRHEFDLLGSGIKQLGPKLPWLDDFKTGRHYPPQYCRDIQYMELDRPTDVKVPWELSRCQHFTVLGQAYWLTGDEKYAAEFRREVEDWLTANPFAYSVNWACAMDVALRAVNWIWGFHFMAGSAACNDAAFRQAFLHSLFTHGEFVMQHLERGDVNGNHYLSDGVGLVFTGLFFKHTAAGRRWLEQGKQIVFDEMPLQVSEDGVDFEQSTSYQRLVLELFMTGYLLLGRHGETVPEPHMSRLSKMAEYVAAYTKPNGLAPLIGDADDGRVQKLGPQAMNDHRYLISTVATHAGRPDLKDAAGRFWEESFWLLGPEAAERFDRWPTNQQLASKAFPAGGVYVLRSPRAHVVVDFGEVGMRGRGGHGHNDISSFELFLDGANLISDCGAYLYTASREWRNHFRSTRFHNVAQVGGEELNRFLGPDALWQLHDDARPANVRWWSTGTGGYLSGEHTGYQRLTPPVASGREFFVSPEDALVVVRDRLTSTNGPEVTWRWHLDPAVVPEVIGSDCRLRTASGEAWILGLPGDQRQRRIESGWISPSYGVRFETSVLVVTDSNWPATMTAIFSDRQLPDSERRAAVGLLDAAAARTQ